MKLSLKAMGLMGAFLGTVCTAAVPSSSFETQAGVFSSAPQGPGELKRTTVGRGSSFYQVLREHSVAPQEISRIGSALKPHFDVRKIRPGMPILVEAGVDDSVRWVSLELSPQRSVTATRKGTAWRSEVKTRQVDRETMRFSGKIEASFFRSALRSGVPLVVADQFPDIFDSMVDFRRETRAKDRWRLVVERKSIDGKPIGWGEILAAELESAGLVYQAVRFEKSGLRHRYYTPTGSSMMRMFLKSPIKAARITSVFSKSRFHPILKIKRPHLGIDYAAPTGTPVRATGDGVVTFAGRNGGGGLTIRIRHSSKYRTAYKHLSGFHRKIKRGSRVNIGQVIGYVGSTGQATGPHLHYEFLTNGKFVDPLGLSFPSVDPIPTEMLEGFRPVAQSLIDALPPWQPDGPLSE